MTETTGKGRSVGERSPLYGWWMERRRRFLLFCLILGGAIAAYVIGLQFGRWDLAESKQLNQQLQSENQRLKKELAQQTEGLVALQAELKAVEAVFEEIMPSKNTYKISPNQSLVVADGRLTVGLIGSPTNEHVNMNINGKQQLAAPGDVIDIPLVPPAKCQVRVQSFDMFKATITASCTGL